MIGAKPEKSWIHTISSPSLLLGLYWLYELLGPFSGFNGYTMVKYTNGESR